MPVTQRKRSFQLFRKLQFCSGSADDEQTLDIDRIMLHILECLGGLQCVMGRYDTARANVFWNAVHTAAEIGLDSLSGHMDKRHPGATHLIRAFPNDSKATDGRSWLPLHWAAVCDDINPEDVRTIAKEDPLATLKGFNHPHSANPGHLIAAVRKPNMAVVKCLYDFYPRMAYSKDIQGDLPLHYAARYTQSIELIQYLLQANPSATKCKGDNDYIPLQCAIYNEHPPSRYEIMKTLLQVDRSSAMVANPDGDSALHLAVDNECDPKVIQLLISAYPEASRIANDIGMLPLHSACHLKRSYVSTVIKVLLNANPDGVRARNLDGWLPAHVAAQFSNTEVLKAIIDAYPAATMIVSNEGTGTPLHHAVQGKNVSNIAYLCNEYPECVKVRNGFGYLPLHNASGCGDNLDIVKILFKAYPEAIKLFTNDGQLPLHVFAIEEHDETILENDVTADILRFLLKVFPDAVNIPNANGKTVFSLCKQENMFYRRLLLRAKPELNYNEYIELNYQPRRMAMFLSFAAINADGEPTIWCRLRERNIELLKIAISYL